MRTGEKIPVDGVVVGGSAAVNQAPIMAKACPVDKTEGTQVFAGTIVESGAIDVRTDRVGGDTIFSRIIALVESAESEKSTSTEAGGQGGELADPGRSDLSGRRIPRHARCLEGGDAVDLHIAGRAWQRHRSSAIAAIARAARSGILIKGGLYLSCCWRRPTRWSLIRPAR